MSERLGDVPEGVFVTGTGTGVGKTVVAAMLLVDATIRGARRAGYLKPVQTGVAPGQGDAAFVRKVCQAADVECEVEVVYELPEALAPEVAAERAGVVLEPGEVSDAYSRLAGRCDAIVVEGAGGLLVPFAPGVLMADLARMLGLPLVVVCSPVLGTLNHARLTVEAAVARDLDVAGVVISGWPAHPGVAEKTNRERIAEFVSAPLLGAIPEVNCLDTEDPSAESVAALLGNVRECD